MSEFHLIRELASVMAGYGGPWWVAGGWAIDLFLGRETRPHGDLEIGLFREHQAAVRRHLRGWTLSGAVGGAFRPWAEDERIHPPLFQLQAAASGGESPLRQFDLFLDDERDGRWICRRHPEITVPLDEATLPADPALGLPSVRYLRPEIQLLYKAKHHRPQDEHDFALALPLLSATHRRWLCEAIAQTYGGGDAWIERLRDRPAGES